MKKFIPTPRLELSERHERMVGLLGQLAKWDFRPASATWTGKGGHLSMPARLMCRPHKGAAHELASLLGDRLWSPGIYIRVADSEDARFLEYYQRLLQ